MQSADPLREQPSNLGNFETFKEQHTSKLVDQKRANDQQIINEMTSIQQFLQLKILELERRNAEVAATNASKYNSLLA